MKTMTKTLVGAASASALTVTAAVPAMAISTDHVLWYVENDKNYTFEFDYVSTQMLPNKRDFDSLDGDSCDNGNTKQGSVASGEHKYLCWSDVGWSTFEATGRTWIHNTISNPVAVTDAGRYPLGDAVQATQWSGQFPSSGRTDPENPSWVDVRFATSPTNSNYADQTWTLTWEAPVAQEAQLQSLIEMPSSECTITGTPGDDVIQGTDGDDVICGLGGNDVIDAGDGDDIVKGGAGDDRIKGGDGDDVLGGGAGDDRIAGGNGDDTLHGATGEDILFGGDGEDLTKGGSGDDYLAPGLSNDPTPQVRTNAETEAANKRFYAARDVADRIHHDSLMPQSIVEDGDGDGNSAQGTSTELPPGCCML